MYKAKLTTEGARQLGVPQLADTTIDYKGLTLSGNTGMMWHEGEYIGDGISNQDTEPDDPGTILLTRPAKDATPVGVAWDWTRGKAKRPSKPWQDRQRYRK